MVRVSLAVPFSWPKVFEARCEWEDAQAKNLGRAAGIVGIERVGRGVSEYTAVDTLNCTGNHSVAIVAPARPGVHSMETCSCAGRDEGRCVEQAMQIKVE